MADEKDKDTESTPSVFDSAEALEDGFARIRAENRARQVDQATRAPLAPDDRKIVEAALGQSRAASDALATALDEGWPCDVDGLPVISNWIQVSKTRLPCLEGNAFGPGTDGTVRSQSAPLLLLDAERGLALTTTGWVRAEQPLVPPKQD